MECREVTLGPQEPRIFGKCKVFVDLMKYIV